MDRAYIIQAIEAVNNLNPRFIQSIFILARARGQILLAARTNSTGTVRFYAYKPGSGNIPAKRGFSWWTEAKDKATILAYAKTEEAGLPKFWREAIYA